MTTTPNPSEILTDEQEVVGQSLNKLAQIYPLSDPCGNGLTTKVSPQKELIIFDDYVPLEIDWQPMKISELIATNRPEEVPTGRYGLRKGDRLTIFDAPRTCCSLPVRHERIFTLDADF